MKPKPLLVAVLLCPTLSQAAIVVWGNEYSYVTNPPALEHVTAIAAGGTFGMALKRDGNFAVWGDPCNAARLEYKAITNASSPPIVLVAGGPATSAVLFADGSARSWGDTESRYTIGPGSGVIQLGCGRESLFGLRANGTVLALGEDLGGAVIVPADLAGVTAIAVNGFPMALKSDGTIAVWGVARYGPDELTNIPPAAVHTVAIAAGQSHALALQADGSVLAWGRDIEGQASIPSDLPKAKAIAAGRLHSLALGRDGKIYGWGDNSHGELDVPPGLGRVLAIAAGCGWSMALTAEHPRMSARRGDNGELELILEAEPGGDYGIECFENSAWWPLLSITNLEASPKVFSDPAWAGREGRFYRALMR